MTKAFIVPGKIWQSAPLSPEYLRKQWSEEIIHVSANINLRELAFGEEDWASWEWNAKEALYLNRHRGIPGKLPLFRDRLQLRINFHLIHAFQKLISGWRQWEKLPHIDTSSGKLVDSNLSFLLVSALGRLEQAEAKQSSLQSQPNKIFQTISLRQHRFYQQLAALLLDLNPFVLNCLENKNHDGTGDKDLSKTHEDIVWHAEELVRLVGGFDYKPTWIERFSNPGKEINRLLGTACLFHAGYLKALL